MLICAPGATRSTFLESPSTSPRTETLSLAFGRSGIAKRPSPSVTTILVYFVGRSFVSAITQTPASGPFGPATMPTMSSPSVTGDGAMPACRVWQPDPASARAAARNAFLSFMVSARAVIVLGGVGPAWGQAYRYAASRRRHSARRKSGNLDAPYRRPAIAAPPRASENAFQRRSTASTEKLVLS